MTKCQGARVPRCRGAKVLLFVLVLAWPAHAVAQGTNDADRVMTAVRAAFAPALPFPDTDDTGSVPANGSPVPLWMVRPPQSGDRTIEVMANPLNEINQARATRAMAQIGAAIGAAQRRAEAQYDRAVAEAKRTGRSQEVDGVGLADEGVAGARIDAEGHVSIDVDFNQPSYAFAVASSIPPAPSRQVAITGSVAVITVPANEFRVRTAKGTEERYCPAESIVYFGTLGTPEVRERSDQAFEVVTAAIASENKAAVRSMTIRLRGNEVLIADILRKADWNQVQELLK